MAKSIKDLDLKVNDLKTFFSSEISKFRNEIEKVKTPTTEDDGGDVRISEILNNFDLFSAAVNNRLDRLESQISALRKDMDVCSAQVDKNIQLNNRGKILLLGLEEHPSEDLLSTVVNVINSKLGLSIKKDYIFYSYRLGRKSDKRVRPIVVEFCNMWARNEVLRGKKLLKGSGFVITEFLSPTRYEVFKLARQKFGRDCWINKGMIGFKVNGIVKYVTTAQQFNLAAGSVVAHPTDGVVGTVHNIGGSGTS